ncbi:hypothetical protein T07_9290 [Trichinella nelsoni]|uniref:Uncharacterized protein n=2 Tax=Trichinella TaxID=6333 RepID=A0A0V0S0F8_9BILA|nr:hypothetical protein T07_9290 [Trichinella nelsoni]KRY37158.1 hypothetical protein T01_5779 [Trichinella spiralis]
MKFDDDVKSQRCSGCGFRPMSVTVGRFALITAGVVQGF